MINKDNFKVLSLLLILITVSSCSTYPNKFKCGDAKGLGCTMLRDVDKQIDSGQIEEAYKTENTRGKKCRGKNCTIDDRDMPEVLHLKKQNTAKSYKDEPDNDDIEDDESLRF